MDLDDVRSLAPRAARPTYEAPHFDLTSFRVGTKIFATAPPDGDHVRIFVDEGEVAGLRRPRTPPAFEELRWGEQVAGVSVAPRRRRPGRASVSCWRSRGGTAGAESGSSPR